MNAGRWKTLTELLDGSPTLRQTNGFHKLIEALVPPFFYGPPQQHSYRANEAQRLVTIFRDRPPESYQFSPLSNVFVLC